MSRLLVSVCALAILLLAPPASGSEWEIDASHSSAQFAVRHFMVSTVRGTFGTLSGAVNLDEQDITQSSVTAEIDVTSIDTREAKRDEHLRGTDFFDVEKHPTMRFVSKKVEQIDATPLYRDRGPDDEGSDQGGRVCGRRFAHSDHRSVGQSTARRRGNSDHRPDRVRPEL